MSALDQIVVVNISQETTAIPQASFSIPAIFGPSNRFAPTVGITGTTVSGSPVLTALSSTEGISPGCSISGTGVPTGSYVLQVSGSTVTMSQNASAGGSTVALTFEDAIRAYTTPASMLTDGFQTTDPEYIRAEELVEQDLTPPIFYVGRYGTPVAQVTTVTPDVSSQTVQHFIQTIASVPYDFTSDASPTAAEVVTGLIALINADSACPATATGTTTLILTAKVAGGGFSTAESLNLTAVQTTPNHSIVDDIAQAQVQNDSWYGVSICSNADGDIEQTAAFIEAQTKIFIGVSADSAIGTSSTTDIGSVLKGKSYKRTALMFSPASFNQGIEAGWLGGQLPATPGSNNWAFKTIVGVSPDTLSATQQVICIGIPEAGTQGKNVNIYQTVGGVNITEMGTMAGGQYIDITVGVDWLKSTIKTNLFAALVNSLKIPYTDKGTQVLISAVEAAIQQGVNNGLIDGQSLISVTAPLVATVPINQRANRISPTISFTCRLQGAFNAVIVQGTVTV